MAGQFDRWQAGQPALGSIGDGTLETWQSSGTSAAAIPGGGKGGGAKLRVKPDAAPDDGAFHSSFFPSPFAVWPRRFGE